MSNSDISIEEAVRRLKRLEEAHEYQRKRCGLTFKGYDDRLAEGVTKMAEHSLKLKHLCEWRDSVGEDIEKIKDGQGISKNYLIGILVSLVVASVLMALNLLVTG